MIIADGEVPECGNHDQLITANGTSARLIALQARGYAETDTPAIWLPVTVAVAATLAGLLEWLRRRHLVVTVRGPSMVPTYRNGDRVLVRRRSGGRLRTDQVAVVDLPERMRPCPDGTSPENILRNRRVIKRVAAAPGDPVPFPIEGNGPVAPPGCLVLLGDNPDGSGDSRQYGYVPADAVVGVVLRVLRERVPGGP
ncbi:S26 family signal peptidase [Streptosporangium sp. CA-135522]|uniref:S26 family signal peptidase n=1 Tax=Streptosporangium sp. CA-135522 TaxID=3240072 RepID=UPI003D8F57C5